MTVKNRRKYNMPDWIDYVVAVAYGQVAYWAGWYMGGH